MSLIAFNNDPSLKEFVLAQLAEHREADKLVKGQYWENGKGCAVGCTLRAVSLRDGKEIDYSSHALYETSLGIPQIIARLEDRIFEALQNGDSQSWPERFTSAIRPGSDLTMVWPKFALWLLTEEVPQHTKNKRSLAALTDVAALYREWIDKSKPSTERWLEARRNATATATAYATATAASAASAAEVPVARH